MQNPRAFQGSGPQKDKPLGLYLAMCLGLLFFCVPLYYMFSTSFKAEPEVFAIPVHWVPHTFLPENYLEAFLAAPFPRYLGTACW